MKEENDELLQAEFRAAAPGAAIIQPPKVMVSLPLDADVLAYFQGEAEPSDWRKHVNGVLRYYMETNEMMEADAELAARIGQQTPEPTPA